MDKILEVKNLKISFRTPGGILKAVRNISFDLERGKTLAIVGESGSGKSVTSKAILGILAGNSIVEGGEILYDGKDLLKIPEEDMHKLRGDKISMIFQDPLSSLNSIVRIGKQITEAMLLKNKQNRREARRDFNKLLGELKKNMIEAGVDSAYVDEAIQTFDKFNIEGIKLESGYMEAIATAEELTAAIKDFLFRVSKKQKIDLKARLKEFSAKLSNVNNIFLSAYAGKLDALKHALHQDILAARNVPAGVLPKQTEELLNDILALLNEILEQERPNFFRIGFYKLKNPETDLSGMSVAEANELSLNYLNENFMAAFVEHTAAAMRHSYEKALEQKKKVVALLEEARTYYAGSFKKGEALKYCKKLSDAVESSIDRLETTKDSIAYTFRSGLENAIEKFFYYEKKNPKEEKRFAKQSKKREALIAKGKNVDWKVVPKATCEQEVLYENFRVLIDRLHDHYKAHYVEISEPVVFEQRAVALIDFFKEKASQVVYRVTKAMAKEKAIKLMEEVGISEPRLRYYQYPFEFSGGMRQRIVIAIALAANPDILICDEPTTALDVTIQAQILELINKLKKERKLTIIFITHDLGVVANMADEIAVMYAGKIVEKGTAEDIFYDPRHPYTWALLSSMPDLDTSEKLDAIPGTPPNLVYPPVGDAFADRNKYALKIDFEQEPPMFEVSPTHKAATWLLHPNAPKIEMPAIITERIARMRKNGGEQHGE